DDGLGEAADAVATHLGPAAVGVVEHHPHERTADAGRDEQPVGADPAAPVAHLPRQLGEACVAVDGRVDGDEEVVAEAVVLGQAQGGRHVVAFSSASRTIGAASATGSLAIVTQRTRGSRRNHRSWRTANWRVRSTTRATASSSVARPSRWSMSSL